MREQLLSLYSPNSVQVHSSDDGFESFSAVSALRATTSHKGKEKDTREERSSVFLQVLCAPYQSTDRFSVALQGDFSQSSRRTGISQGSYRSLASTGTTLPGIPSPVTLCAEDHARALYVPHGKWAWAAHTPITNSKELMNIDYGSSCSVTLNAGFIGNQSVTYVRKSWRTNIKAALSGLYKELALFKGSDHLKSLQGDVVPSLIGVFSSPGEISLVMEAPNHSFWIEASIDMPDIFKERCVKSFRKIHSRGVLHGDIDLRNMLIGADGNVTIVNFQAGRALVPIELGELYKATEAEIEMEMRKVKFKLDYLGARQKEEDKLASLREHNSWWERHSGTSASASRSQKFAVSDSFEPPVPLQDWNKHWTVPRNQRPRRIVVPGRAPELVAIQIRRLLDIVKRFVNDEALMITQQAIHRTSPPHANLPTHQCNLRKRKAPESDDLGPSKRHRTLEQQKITEDSRHSIYQTVPCGPIAEQAPPVETYPPLKARDFVHEKYDGLRGYYVPHPPTEARAAFERRRYIYAMNPRQRNKCCVARRSSGTRFSENALHEAAIQNMLHLNSRSSGTSLGKRKREKDVAQDGVGDTEEVPEVDSRGPSPSRQLRGILRKTRPVKQISYNKEDWIEPHIFRTPSPERVGPIPGRMDRIGHQIMLGMKYKRKPPVDTADGDASTALAARPKPRKASIIDLTQSSVLESESPSQINGGHLLHTRKVITGSRGRPLKRARLRLRPPLLPLMMERDFESDDSEREVEALVTLDCKEHNLPLQSYYWPNCRWLKAISFGF